MSSTDVRSSGLFDRFAATVGAQVARPWFFAACTVSILVWAVTGPLFAFNETWQLVVNTGTTIVTFLLVALLQNTQDRSTKAISHKLDAIMEALEDVLDDTEGLREMMGVEMEPSDE